MRRLEKILRKQLNDNEEAVESMMNHYISCFEAFIKNEEKTISNSEADIQKILSDIANNDPDNVIANIFDKISEKDNSISNINTLEEIKQYLFEELPERSVVKGLKKK